MVDYPEAPNLIPDEVKNYNAQTNFEVASNFNSNTDFEKYKNVTNISEVPHKHLIQSNPNEFQYKKNKKIILHALLFILVSGGVLAGLICILIYKSDDEDTNVGGVYIGIALSGFIFITVTLAFFCSALKVKIILEQNCIKIVSIIYFCCLPKKSILKHKEIVRFDVEISERNKSQISIIYYDIELKKKYFETMDFCVEEAEFLAYVLNNHLEYLKTNYAPEAVITVK